MNISVIVPTYNRPKALKLCLLSLSQQSVLPSEVLVADDGSTSETRDVVRVMRKLFKHLFPIIHVWQEDDGFRKPKILNETVRQSNGNYLIFIDGDCMAHRHFIRAHIEESDTSTILGGKRVEIGKHLTESLLHSGTLINCLTLKLIIDSIMKRSRKVEEALVIRHKLLRKLTHRDRIPNDGIWGCNFSLYKQLFLDINGCDEDFLDGSFEDNDLGVRVLNQGKRIKSTRNLAIIFHLWHPFTWNFGTEKHQINSTIIRRRIVKKEMFCKNGILKLE